MKSEGINKMTFSFNENGKFEAYMMGEIERGNWTLNKDSDKIILNTTEVNPIQLTILK